MDVFLFHQMIIYLMIQLFVNSFRLYIEKFRYLISLDHTWSNCLMGILIKLDLLIWWLLKVEFFRYLFYFMEGMRFKDGYMSYNWRSGSIFKPMTSSSFNSFVRVSCGSKTLASAGILFKILSFICFFFSFSINSYYKLSNYFYFSEINSPCKMVRNLS